MMYLQRVEDGGILTLLFLVNGPVRSKTKSICRE